MPEPLSLPGSVDPVRAAEVADVAAPAGTAGAAGAFAVVVVGIGEDGWDGLTGPALAALAEADVVIGGPRQLALVEGHVRAAEAWPRDLVGAVSELPRRYAGRRVAVLASGDPMYFGVGNTLVRALGADRVRVLPAPSSVSLACARLGWPGEDVAVVSAVGRPYESVRSELWPGARVLVLVGDEDGAARLARLAAEAGLGGTLTVLERLGGPHENVATYPLVPVVGTVDGIRQAERPGPAFGTSLDGLRHHRLAVVALSCAPPDEGLTGGAPAGGAPAGDAPGAGSSGDRPPAVLREALFSRAPGLPDDAFATDGVLTKSEIRAVTLAALAPLPGQLLWDVGAGSGTVAVEWLRSDRRCRAVAVEPRADRCAFVAANAARLAGAAIQVVHGRAPEALAGLPAPDAVFVGGGATVPGVVEACLAALRPGGRLVVNAVTLETEAAVAGWRARVGGELRRISVARAEPVGTFTAFRPALPVTQWVHTKRSPTNERADP